MKTSRSLFPQIGFTFAIILAVWNSALRAQPGALDTTFNAIATSGHWGYSIAVQPDGKVIAAGSFGLLRLLKDGSVDPTFPRLFSAAESPFGQGRNGGAVALQSNGKVVVTGSFTNASGTAFAGVMRLNNDGSLDPSFNLDPNVYPGARVLALQPDGKIVTDGYYVRPGEDPGYLVRLLPDGSLDPDWDARGYENAGSIFALSAVPDGKIYFGTVTGVTRVNPDGSHDESFNADPGTGPWAGIAVQLDGKVIVGGYSDGDGYRPVRRLLTDGTDDPDWNGPGIGGGDAVIYALLLQPDGKVLVGGNNLQSFNGVANPSLGRLNPDGTVDTTFDAGADLHYYSVEALALAPDGKIVGAGYHSDWPDLASAPAIWRLSNDTGMQPQLEITFTANEGITLGLRGQPGATYRLEYRELLSGAGSWTPLTNLTSSAATVTYKDTGWTNSTSRFYRAVSLP